MCKLRTSFYNFFLTIIVYKLARTAKGHPCLLLLIPQLRCLKMFWKAALSDVTQGSRVASCHLFQVHGNTAHWYWVETQGYRRHSCSIVSLTI